MGCWDETCYISRLGIASNDECVAIVAIPVEKKEFFYILPLIEGKYDDYGSLDDWKVLYHKDKSLYKYLEDLLKEECPNDTFDLENLQMNDKDIPLRFIKRSVFDYIMNNNGFTYHKKTTLERVQALANSKKIEEQYFSMHMYTEFYMGQLYPADIPSALMFWPTKMAHYYFTNRDQLESYYYNVTALQKIHIFGSMMGANYYNSQSWYQNIEDRIKFHEFILNELEYAKQQIEEDNEEN